jgi:hypothetical protein
MLLLFFCFYFTLIILLQAYNLYILYFCIRPLYHHWLYGAQQSPSQYREYQLLLINFNKYNILKFIKFFLNYNIVHKKDGQVFLTNVVLWYKSVIL